MIDIKLIRENKEKVIENIKKKFQDEKIPLVEEIIALDVENRALKLQGDELRAKRNDLSNQIGLLMRDGKKDETENIKLQVSKINDELKSLEEKELEINSLINSKMMIIPNIIADDVPIGKDDSENVELRKFGDPVVPEYDVPYHAEIMENLCGLDLDSARIVSGNGFYYLLGDIARLQSAMLSYVKDYMISKGFVFVIPPFMIRASAVDGVMSFSEKDAMMYKIEGEDLYLVGTSEHSMIAKFKGQILDADKLPYKLTSYSPCFRKEVGAHGIEERGIYRVHQFEKQEMIVVCKPEDSDNWYEKLWNYTVEIFRNLNIPVRTLECCSGDLADLKYKSVDIEAWSPRQQKYYEVGSCSNLTDAQSRRLGIRVKEGKEKYFAHTLNNTALASTRALIAVVENNYNKDGSVNVPKCLQSYMGGETVLKKID